MSKWENASERKQNEKLQKLLEQSILQQQELLKETADIGDKLGQVNILLDELFHNVDEVKKSINAEIDQRFLELDRRIFSRKSGTELGKAMAKRHEENCENFQTIISLLKAVLVNEILDDMEKLIMARKER